MIRRKLFAYTVMFTAGISAGFFIFEKTRLLSGSLLMTAIAALICVMDTDGRLMLRLKKEMIPSICKNTYRLSEVSCTTESSGKPRLKYYFFLEKGKHELTRQKTILLACLMAGFLIFTFRYLSYGTCNPYSSNVDVKEKETAEENTGQSDKVCVPEQVTGFVRSVTVKDDKMKIILSDTDVLRHGIRVLVTVKSNEKQSDNGGESGDPGVNTYEHETEDISSTEYISNGYVFDVVPMDIIGRRVTAYGLLKEPLGADNPGCFDYRVYLRSKGIGYICSSRYIDLVDCNDSAATSSEESDKNDGHSLISTAEMAGQHTHPFRNAAEMARKHAQKLYGKYLRILYSTRESFLNRFEDPDIRSFIKGAVFGDKSDISDEIMDDFTGNGTGHILAVSGLHTGFLYALLRFLSGKRKTIGTALLTISILFLYGDMTMWSPSTMRAVTVLSVSILALYVRRPFDLLSSVSAAAVLILIKEPYQLLSTGFQMSFLALLGIAFLAKPLSHFIGDALAVMISVQAGILPVTAFVFHRINLLSVFINIPIIFLASILVPACMIALFISSLIGTIPQVLILVTEGLTELVIRINGIMSVDGIFSNFVTSAGGGVILLFYLTAFLLASEWCRIRLLRHEYRYILNALGCILIVSLFFSACFFNKFADDEIVFVAVGQGDCTHIRAGGKDVLIDGGGSTERNIGEDVLMPYLLANGAERTEIACVTHLHTDHYRGIAELAQIYPVGTVGIPSDYRKSIEQSEEYTQRISGNVGTDESFAFPENSRAEATPALPENIMFVEPDSVIRVTDDVYIEPIWPVSTSGGDIEVDDPNEHNMVYMIHYKGVKIMVTGDLLEEDELKMVEYYRHMTEAGVSNNHLKCDILKVAHHGSKSSSCETFLEAAEPSIAVIQVGRNNFYGHPHQQTLDRLEERGITTYRTDLNGAVGIDIRGRRIIIDRFK